MSTNCVNLFLPIFPVCSVVTMWVAVPELVLVQCLKGEGQVSADGDVAVTWFGLCELCTGIWSYFFFF